MKPTLLLSDLHLAPEHAGATAAFHAFARGPARAAAAVYILGDLFDAWIGDDQRHEPFAQSIVDSLKSIRDAGVPVYIAAGNRDFLLGREFCDAVGAELLDEQTIVDLGGTQTLLTHGDEFCTDDVGYQRYRAWTRDPRNQRRLRGLPSWMRGLIRAYLRRKSRTSTALKPEYILDVNADSVADAFRRFDVPRMVHGHTHRPARHQSVVDGKPRERIVLSDWNDRGHYLEVDATGARSREING
jgi:UDP-2,3-diacylglucosamine hydrolase